MRLIAVIRRKIGIRSNDLVKAFLPLRIFLTLIGQMPFVTRRRRSGLIVFKFNLYSSSALIYCVLFLTTTTSYLLVLAGICSFVGGVKYSEGKDIVMVKDPLTDEVTPMIWERYITRKEMATTVVVWSWMTTAFIGSLITLLNGKDYVHFMNTFNRAFHVMEVELSPGLSRYIFFNNVLLLFSAFCLVLGFSMTLLGFSPVINACAVLSNFIFRNFGIQIYSHEHFDGFVAIGLALMIFASVGSRANVLQFLYYGKLLQNLCAVWNLRLYSLLKNNLEEVTHDRASLEADQVKRRAKMGQLLKDHILLIQMFKLTEHIFRSVLVTYYAMQIVAIVIGIYQIAALGGFGTYEVKFDNPSHKYTLDDLISRDDVQEFEMRSTAIVTILLLVQNCVICYRTTVDAAKAYETAMEGLNILRRYGFMYCKTDKQRNFIISLFHSFARNRPLQISASYFSVNKTLLASLVSAVIEWSISIYQTRVNQWQ